MFAGLVLALGENLTLASAGTPISEPRQDELSQKTFPRSSLREKQFRSNDRVISGKGKKPQTITRKSENNILGIAWAREGILSGLLLALILVTLGFDYISTNSSTQNITSIITGSFFHGGSAGGNSSLALLFFTSWIIIGLVLILEVVNSHKGANTLFFTLTIYVLSILIGFLFIAWHAGNLSGIIRSPSSEFSQILNQVKGYENTFSTFVFFSVFLLLIFGWFSVDKWPQKFASLPGKILSPIVVGLTIIAMVFLNIRAIRADIVFKAADSYIRAASWPTAIRLFSRSIELAPKEDYYYLFLAKAYFEYSKTLPDEASRLAVLKKAELDMEKAQGLNPLNTDHTANLARLYSTWSELIEDPKEQTAKAQQASNYYEQAVNLSPNNSRILGEWAFILFSQLNQQDQAYQLIKRALAIDPKYDWLHGLLGEFYFQLAEITAG